MHALDIFPGIGIPTARRRFLGFIRAGNKCRFYAKNTAVYASKAPSVLGRFFQIFGASVDTNCTRENDRAS
ncbi:hypothetical protein BT96DRAFT_929687 [Gymnopus androsaceus JB14]|uniref:Uncharacterized protein n=1 Tax=Gymnopus androsaceus JB14 TaxID=1447944 RepID=A0A6A4GDW5_9AGAR|nr:hypothetical protein BT96DRAFT_929687 [Gymnopus androsaceus JB14]